MRIAVFSKKTTLHADFGGLETQNKMLCEGLAARGHQVVVYSPAHDLHVSDTTLNNVTYKFIPSKTDTKSFYFSAQNWYRKSVVIFLEDHALKPYDLIIGQSSSAYGLILKKHLHGVKVVSICHGSIMSELRTRYANLSGVHSYIRFLKDMAFAVFNFFNRQRGYVHGSDALIAVSTYVKNSLIDETYTHDSKFTVIHNAVDRSFFEYSAGNRPQTSEAGRVKLLYVGQLLRDKGVDKLCSLLADSDMQDVLLDIVGSGPFEEELRSQIERSGLSSRITLLGKIPHAQLPQLFQSPDYSCFVFPTNRLEGFPMVVAESISSGLPVVGYDMGGVRDGVIDGVTGYLVPAGHFELFKKKVGTLVSDTSLQRDLSAKCMSYARTHLTLDVMIERYLQVFSEVLKV